MLAFSMRKFFWGLILIVIGGLLWAHNFGLVAFSISLSRDWPLIIVVFGLMAVWNALFGRHWWSAKSDPRGRNWEKGEIKKILEELEKGDISADEAAKRMEK
ncbi:MAG: DUF5668 domain-containing protein [Elusimicrobia bacterium]|nr:DUF5668 domain-containing protein [Elusimicrobiota bacterium]